MLCSLTLCFRIHQRYSVRFRCMELAGQSNKTMLFSLNQRLGWIIFLEFYPIQVRVTENACYWRNYASSFTIVLYRETQKRARFTRKTSSRRNSKTGVLSFPFQMYESLENVLCLPTGNKPSCVQVICTFYQGCTYDNFNNNHNWVD